MEKGDNFPIVGVKRPTALGIWKSIGHKYTKINTDSHQSKSVHSLRKH